MDVIFLKLDNIEGESQAKGFEKQLEIMTFSHNVAMPVTNDVSNNERTSGRAHVGEMSLTKFVDLATPKLNEYCCSGKMIKEAVLTLCRNDNGKMLPFIIYTLTNVVISHLSVSGGSGGKCYEGNHLILPGRDGIKRKPAGLLECLVLAFDTNSRADGWFWIKFDTGALLVLSHF